LSSSPPIVIRSLLSPAVIATEILRAYPLTEPVECVLWRSLTNDVYRLITPTALYFLKVYGPGWRSADELAWEMDFLSHLTAQRVAVAPAIPRRDGQAYHVLHAPEGPRYCALFANTPGAKPKPPFTPALYQRFGRAAGALHRAADTFSSQHRRFALDLNTLLDQPLAVIEPHFVHRPADWDFLTRLAERVRTHITAFAASLDWGACHGDLTLDCFHLTENDEIIFYDFDSGGPGWRAFEIQGVYANNETAIWEAFLAGYAEERPLSTVDLAAVPWCVPLYTFSDIGWITSQWATWSGQWRLTDEYWDEQVRGLAQWESKHLRYQ
jgi:Ser/Thr protein kinase RdoA (MazF antagonist)